MQSKLRTFVVQNYLFGEEGKLGNEDSFMESGIIDSTGILELVRFIESEFGVKVADEELIPDNLDSINKIAAFIEKKRSSTTTVAETSSLHSIRR